MQNRIFAAKIGASDTVSPVTRSDQIREYVKNFQTQHDPIRAIRVDSRVLQQSYADIVL